MNFREKSAVWWIIAVNLVVYLIMIFYPISLDYLALTASNIIHGKYIWTLFTHMFSHIWFFHLFVNMFSLWFVGRFAEKIIGKKRFVLFYILAGLFAGIISALGAGYFGYGFGERIFGVPDIPMLGASGAIFGIVGLLAMLVPYARVYLIVGPLIAIILQFVLGAIIKSSTLLGLISLIVNLYIIASIFLIFSFNPKTRKIIIPVEMPFWLLPFIAIIPLFVIGLFVFLPIGNVAHFGGLLAGLIYGAYLRVKYKRKVQALGRYFR